MEGLRVVGVHRTTQESEGEGYPTDQTGGGGGTCSFVSGWRSSQHFRENVHLGDLVRDAWVKQEMEGIADKVNSHEETMTTNLEHVTQELRDAWLL